MPFEVNITKQVSESLYEGSGTCFAKAANAEVQEPIEVLVKQAADKSLSLYLDGAIRKSTFGNQEILWLFHDPLPHDGKLKEGEKIVFEKVTFNIKK
jgi:hypothetical protein